MLVVRYDGDGKKKCLLHKCRGGNEIEKLGKEWKIGEKQI